jgi:peptidoglycan/LPS O-acetylase OafA/YrhL
MSYDKNPNLKEYAKNRILRIYPALIVNIFLGVLILYYFGFIKFNSEFYKWLIAQLSIVQFYNAEMFRDFGVGVINGSLWTISVELTFYILLPILFILFKKSRKTIGFIFVVSFLLWLYDIDSNKEIFLNKLLHTTIAPYLFVFIIGIGFYKYNNKIMKFIDNKFLIWFIVFIFYNGCIYIFDLDKNIFLYIFQWTIFSFMIFSFAFSFKGASQTLLKGNDFTYGIYIYHMLVINIFVQLHLVGSMKYLGLVLLISIILGILSWYIIEQPFLRLKKHSLFKELHKYSN